MAYFLRRTRHLAGKTLIAAAAPDRALEGSTTGTYNLRSEPEREKTEPLMHRVLDTMSFRSDLESVPGKVGRSLRVRALQIRHDEH